MEIQSNKMGRVRPVPEGEHNAEREYRMLSIVYSEDTNKSYISKKDVPAGINIDNKVYWQVFGNGKFVDNAIINVSYLEDSIIPHTLAEAISMVDEEDRRPGIVLAFFEKESNYNDGNAWILYQFKGSSIDDWDKQQYWTSVYNRENKFKGWFLNSTELIERWPNPFKGDYAYVGQSLNNSWIWRCNNDGTWSRTSERFSSNAIINYYGDINNNPDFEDIDVDEQNRLKFADREPNENEMGYIILRKDKTFVEQVTKENTIYEIRYSFDLDGQSIEIPINCILKFNGGSISDGNLILSDNCRIKGNEATLYKVRILGTNKSGITIFDLKLDSRLNGVNDDTFKSFIYLNGCSNIDINNINLVYFNHTWLEGESGEAVHVLYFYNCNNIKMYNVKNIELIHPEGPSFWHCSNVLVDNVNLTDKGYQSGAGFATCIHAFFSTDVIFRNSDFYHTLLTAGSAINFTVNRGIIDNCNIYGGNGIDIGNEAGENFEADCVIIRNCYIDNSKYICYGSGNDKYTIDNLVVENCTVENIRSFAFDLRDSIKNIKISDCNINFSDGRTICNIKHDSNYGSNVTVLLHNINVNIVSIYDSNILLVANDVDLKQGIISSSTIVKASNTTYTKNYIAFCNIGNKLATPEIIIKNCNLIAPRFNIDTFACMGSINILNSVIKTYNEIAGQSGQVYITRNILSEANPNANIVINNNVFYGISFRIQNISTKVSIINNRFGASVAGNANCIGIYGDSNNNNAVSNLLIVNNFTQESSKKIKNDGGVLDSTVIVEDNYNITKEGFS